MDFSNISQAVSDWLDLKGSKLFLIVLFTVLFLIIARVLAFKLVSVYKKHHEDREMRKRADTLGSMLRYIMSAGIVLITSMLILDLFGVQLGPMLAAAGVVGIAVGFGSQHLIQDITNGFFIMLDDEIRVGDVVKAAGAYGTVERVGLRQTVLRSIDGNVHYIPNSKIDIVTNMTKIYSYCLLNIKVAYREDVDEVFDIINQVYNELKGKEPYSEWIIEPVEILGLDEFDVSAMIIKVRIKVLPIRQWRVKREFNRLMKKAFDRNNIEIPYPHLTMYMGQKKDGTSAPICIKNCN